MTLDEMRKVDIRTVDPATLHDRRDVRIDSRQPREKRIASYLKQIGNPYCYVDDGVVVKIGFMNTRETIDDRLEGYADHPLAKELTPVSILDYTPPHAAAPFLQTETTLPRAVSEERPHTSSIPSKRRTLYNSAKPPSEF